MAWEIHALIGSPQIWQTLRINTHPSFVGPPSILCLLKACQLCPMIINFFDDANFASKSYGEIRLAVELFNCAERIQSP